MPKVNKTICNNCGHGLVFTEHKLIDGHRDSTILGTQVVCVKHMADADMPADGYKARQLGDPIPEDCPMMLEQLVKEQADETAIQKGR
jgi:hypothetical protein